MIRSHKLDKKIIVDHIKHLPMYQRSRNTLIELISLECNPIVCEPLHIEDDLNIAA